MPYAAEAIAVAENAYVADAVAVSRPLDRLRLARRRSITLISRSEIRSLRRRGCLEVNFSPMYVVSNVVGYEAPRLWAVTGQTTFIRRIAANSTRSVHF